MDLPEANRYFTELLSATNMRYDVPYPAEDPVGRHHPDLELLDDHGTRSRLHEHARSGRGLLLLPHGAGTSRRAPPAASTFVPVTNTEPLLICPDGVVAWMSGDRESLDTALDTWFGAGPAATTAPDR